MAARPYTPSDLAMLRLELLPMLDGREKVTLTAVKRHLAAVLPDMADLIDDGGMMLSRLLRRLDWSKSYAPDDGPDTYRKAG